MLVIDSQETGSDNRSLLGKVTRVSVYVVTLVTTHPCSEHVELLDRMCGSMGNVVHGGVVLCAIVTNVELSCGPE